MRFFTWLIALTIIGLWSTAVSAQPNNCYNYVSPTTAQAAQACDFSSAGDAPLLSGHWRVQSADSLNHSDCPLLNGDFPYRFSAQQEGDTLLMRLATAARGGRKFTRVDDQPDTYSYRRTNRITTIDYTLIVLSPEHFTITWTNPFNTCTVTEDYTLIKASK